MAIGGIPLAGVVPLDVMLSSSLYEFSIIESFLAVSHFVANTNKYK